MQVEVKPDQFLGVAKAILTSEYNEFVEKFGISSLGDQWLGNNREFILESELWAELSKNGPLNYTVCEVNSTVVVFASREVMTTDDAILVYKTWYMLQYMDEEDATIGEKLECLRLNGRKVPDFDE